MIAKLAAAKGALELVTRLSPRSLGIGSGTTIHEFIKVVDKGIAETFVSSSIDTTLHLKKRGIYAIEPYSLDEVDVYVDGADSVNTDSGICIKGGGGALFREKLLFELSKVRVIVVDETKLCPSHPCKCYGRIPVDVHPMALTLLIKRLESSACGFEIRKCERGKLPPAISDSCGILLDVKTCEEKCLDVIEETIGVLAHGVFNLRKGDYIVIGKHDGSFEILRV